MAGKEKRCHSHGQIKDDTVLPKDRSDGWIKYGDTWVKETFGKEDLRELLLEYARKVADLRF